MIFPYFVFAVNLQPKRDPRFSYNFLIRVVSENGQ